MSFSTDFTFTRGTGKTRLSRSGLVVGVDFSTSNITFGTGQKTFLLVADPQVNREWLPGRKVIAASQAAPLGSMEGTVVSYDPATQNLVLDVVSSSGTGSGINWRIGDLEITRDRSIGAAESHQAFTNLTVFSEDFTNAAWVKTNGTVTGNTFRAPNGSLHADTLSATGSNATFLQPYSTIAGQYYSEELWLARKVGTGVVEITADGVAYAPVTLTTTLQKFSVVTTALSTATRNFGVRIVTPGDEVYAFGNNFIAGPLAPYIPTTTVQVTQAADRFSLTPDALSRLATSGTLYADVVANDTGPSQKQVMRLSGPGRDIRIAKRGVGSFAGFTKQLEVDDFIYYGNSVGNSQRDDGREFSSIIAAVNQRTGLPDAVGPVADWSYDGTNNIAYTTTNEERFLTKDLSLWSGKGAGGIELRKGALIGTRFVVAANIVGTVFIITAAGYRRVNSAVLSQPTLAVASNGSRLVTVGASGFIAYSDDQGETWVTAGINNAGTIGNLSSVIFAAGLFVATRASNQGGQNIITSPDGIVWTAQTKAGGTNDVAYNGTNLFVAVGAGGSIYTSSNATTWTIQTSAASSPLNAVHFANNLWVAVGVSGVIVTSPNGTTWTARDSGVTNSLNDVTHFNGQFVVVGNSQTIRTSTNGVSWDGRTANLTSTLLGVVESDNLIVAVGTAGGISTSADGITWTSVSNNSAGIEGIAYGASLYYSSGASQGGSGYIAKITNAGEVSRVQGVPNQSYACVKFLRNAFFFCGSSSNIFRISTAGVTQSITLTGLALNARGIADSGTLIVAVGNLGRYTTSADGIAFTPTALADVGQARNLNAVDYADGKFVAVGNLGAILTSLNGTTWVIQESGTTQNLSSIMYSMRDELWYAAGAKGTILVSSDAISWVALQNAGFGSVTLSGILQATQTLPQFRAGLNRLAISYGMGQVVSCINGVCSTQLVSDELFSLLRLDSGVMGENLNGQIIRMRAQAEALSEAELKLITGI